MSKTSKFAAAFGFAPVAEDPEDSKEDKDAKKAKPARMDGESDEDYAKRCEEADKEDPKAAGTKAEGDDKDEKKKEGEEAKAAARAEGVTAERTRWAAVLSAPEAAGRGITACTLLETTDMSAAAIVATLKTVPEHKAAAHGLAARMAAAEVPKPSASAEETAAPGTPKATAQAIIAATAKARGEKIPA